MVRQDGRPLELRQAPGLGRAWLDTQVEPDRPSDPFLMTGFEHKCLHLTQNSGEVARFDIEVDFLGTGSWHRLGEFEVRPEGYAHHEFTPGFNAHWVRLRVDKPCTATAQFVYT